MRAALLLPLALASALLSQAPAGASSIFRLYFLGHDIGRETATWSAEGRRLDSVFHFEDRGTAVDLTGSLELDEKGRATRLVVKGRNYRLFHSDSEVTIKGDRAHVRDFKAERDVELGGKPFFPVDNYAPIGVQEALIQFWLANGRPAEINAAPSGPVRIRKCGSMDHVLGATRREWDCLAIQGVVWGTEEAWVETDTGRLAAIKTWAGALPFAAVREPYHAAPDLLAAFTQDADFALAPFKELTKVMSVVARDTFALVGARVIQATDVPPIDDATIVVRDGRIAAVGPSATTPVPAGVGSLNGRGKTVIPGLWDMHAHASQVDWALVYLASGVTTIRDLGGDNTFLVAIRDAIRKGEALGPRYLLAGLVDGPGPRAFGGVTAATPDEGRAVVRRYHEQGFEQIKIYSLVAPDVVKAIVAEAHARGMTVTGHVPGGMTAQSAVEAGFDSLAHMQLRGEPGSDASNAQIALFRKHGTVMDPTASWNELGGRPASVPLESFLPGASGLPLPLKRMFDSMPGGTTEPAAWRARLVESARLLKRAVDGGLLVVAGTDKGVPGLSLPRELELYVEGGMTPLQAIQTATIMPARAMKLDKELGTIEVGKRADLAVLDADPLADIKNIRQVRWVVANGRMSDAPTLWRTAGFTPPR